MDFELQSARYLAADTMRRVIDAGDHVIDATMGNGHDTCFLAELVGEHGHVTAFDVQADAVAHTEAALKEAGLLDRCSLFVDGHQNVLKHVAEPVKAVVFNLGWLPGGSHEITTLWETTQIAVRDCLSLLCKHGVMTLCVYPGHAAGDYEREQLMELLSHLRPQEYNVLHQKFLNAGAGAPECFVIQRQ